jgi:hypothetical protein
MRSLKILAASAVAGLCFFVVTPPQTQAQISVGIGVAPACPYGYYAAPPYSCAPYGYYGPEWFSSGVFVGAGPWFHGPEHFNGYIDNHYRPENGYKGPYPPRGEKAREGWNGHAENFHGNERHNPHGEVVH